VAPRALVACAQNDVDNEDVAAEFFARVLGMVVRQTSTRVGPCDVHTTGRGRLVVGAHPSGAGDDVEAFAARLRGAGYDVGVSQHIARDKWLKLASNLLSVPNALIRRDEHSSQGFIDVKIRLLEETRDVLRAAGIEARSCDGRDPSIAEMIDSLHTALSNDTSARALPLYNAVWAGLEGSGPVEADLYHQRIIGLAARHGCRVPAHARALACLQHALREDLGPECLGASDFLADEGGGC
jgi:ketopantoate reductase